MKRHLFALGSGIMAVALILSACAPAATPAPTQAPPAAQPPAATQPPAAPQPTATSAPAVTEITEWDYWTDDPVKTSYQTILDECSASTGIAIDRHAIAGNDLLTKVLLGAQQGQLPDVLRLDNPFLQEVAATGALVPLTDYGVDLTGIYPNLLDAGSYNGKVYGIAPGINGLALFYNKDMFEAAGLQPPTTWAEVEVAAAALTKNGVYGIAFSANANEEASWQFEPWFWGAGADLSKLDSPQAVQALQFYTDLVENGYASRSVVQWSQNDVNDQFMAGMAAMQVNGTWNLSALEAAKINFGVVPIPKPDGGAAPGPMGGEVAVIPNSGDAARMEAAGKIVNCLLSDEQMLAWATLQAFIPGRQSLGAQAVANNPNMEAFVDAAAAARSRTGPPANLGPNYNKVSMALMNAIQAALTGLKSPQDALMEAQKQATSP
jgi:multiple sugar transport system substrate-binding protein